MRSIRVYLFSLVATCLILSTTAFTVVFTQANSLSRQQVEAQSRETARAVSQAVDGKLERAIGILSVLSSSPAAQSHDWITLDRQARQSPIDRDAWIVVQDRAGRQFLNTRLAPGAVLPSGVAPREMWRAISNGGRHVCDLTKGIVEKNIVCVDVPIGGGPTPDFAISVIFTPNAFGSAVTRDNVKAGNVAALVDRSGKVIWRNIRPDKFVGKTATGPLLSALQSPSSSGVLQSKSLEGVAMLSAYNRSGLSGWSVIVGSPLNQLGTASHEALRRGSIYALVVFLIGAALATLIGAKLVSSVNALTAAAGSATDRAHEINTGIREIDAVGQALRKSFDDRMQSERHQQILIGELNHRVKNTLAVVQSLAHQTFRGSKSPAEAIGAFEVRLQALAAAHNLLTEEHWESVSMAQLVAAAVRPFCEANRCSLMGPDVKVSPQKAVSIALALHELATNASKYGALSVDLGRVDVTWTTQGEEFVLVWQESEGPKVEQPKSDGFGMKLIRRSLAAELRGAVEITFAESGLQCRIVGRLN